MNEKEIKRNLEDRGLRIADLARELATERDINVRSADIMLRDLISGRRWYPVYAKWLKDRYQIGLVCPPPFLSARERMKAAA